MPTKEACCSARNWLKSDSDEQIVIAAMAILGKLTVADLPYVPPFSLPIDHSIATVHLMENKLKGRLNGIGPVEFRKMLEEGVMAWPFGREK